MDKPRKVHHLARPNVVRKHVSAELSALRAEKQQNATFKFSAEYAQAKRLRSSVTWQKLREMILRRTPLCCICGRPANELHHVEPVARRPDLVFDSANLLPCCTECHDRIEASNARGFETAMFVPPEKRARAIGV